MTTHTKKFPSTAFQFLAKADFSTPTAKGERELTGIAYSGDVVTDHGYWNRLVIDLATLTVDTPIPLLQGHCHDDTIGLVTTVSTHTGQLSINARLFADVDDDAAEIAAKADKGFPWQLSVGIWPKSIEEVNPGESITVNNRTFTGPVVVFRNGRVREISVVAIGADHQTSATVLTAGFDTEIPFITHENPMTTEELKAKVDALSAELTAEKTKNVELSAKANPANFVALAKFSEVQAELSALKDKVAAKDIDDTVNAALLDGRLLPAQEQWARDLGKSQLSALNDFLKVAQPIAALAGTQTGGKAPGEQGLRYDTPVGFSVDSERLSAHSAAVAYQHKHGVDYLTALNATGVN
ncbi:phage protease [Crenothrix polyspora]|nr:phage protease [Crenothrix polyspora]